jgi:tRNA threonylcarbamoyladenosine biosynthesis protein TsaB
MMGDIVAQAGTTCDAVDRLAVCTGPGTFTGLRIGLSVARGLALALGVPCVGVMSLPVLAHQAMQQGGAAQEETVHAVVMGRGGQGFYQAFRGAGLDGLPHPLSAAACLDGVDIAARVAAMPGAVVGSGAALAGTETAHDAVDPLVLAAVSAPLDPALYRPEPAYLRAADAAKAKRLLPVEG